MMATASKAAAVAVVFKGAGDAELNDRDDVFLTQHPAAPNMWLPVRFLTLSDGSRRLHVGERATPKVAG
jgi:hypothetical protein